MSRFAVAVLGSPERWKVLELDLTGCESVDDVTDLLRDHDQPVRLLAVEEDDEYALLLRLDDDTAIVDETPRVFLSNGHAADDYPLARLFAEGLPEIGGDPLEGDRDAPLGAHDAAPFGDPQLLEDLGLGSLELLELAVHEGTLPAVLIETVCDRLGCLPELEAVRG